MIQHHILIKWREGIDRAAMVTAVTNVFSEALGIDGVEKLTVKPSSSDRPNRYDLLVILTVTEDGLLRYDASGMHRKWKEDYGEKIEKKAIFDCEEEAQ